MAPVDLTEKKGPTGFQLFSCCLPKPTPDEAEPQEEDSSPVEFDLPDMGDEEPVASKSNGKSSAIVRTGDDAQHNIVLAFWKMILALMLFNWKDNNTRKAIKVDAEVEDDDSAAPMAPPNMDAMTSDASASTTMTLDK